MNISLNENPYRISCRAGEQGPRTTVKYQTVFDKYITGQQNETNKMENHLLRCKKSILVSSFNVDMLSSDVKMGEITSCAAKEGIDIICIQDHNIFHEEINIHHHQMGNCWMLLTYSAEKASNNATVRGVGILLSPKSYQSLDKIESISPRILLASFNGNPTTTLIFFLFFSKPCWRKAMVAYTKPRQWKKEESKRLRGERDQIKFIDSGYAAMSNKLLR